MDQVGLQTMVDQRQLERCSPDSGEARSRLTQAGADLATVRALLGGTASPTNPKGACSLAWEATLEALLGWLSLFGYRITSERGHHAIAVRATRALLDTREASALLQRLDGLRRLRDNALYNNLPVDADEVAEFVPDVATLASWLERAVDHVRPEPGQASPTSRA
jgi:hypothetical protein